MNSDKKIIGKLTVADVVEAFTFLVVTIVTFAILFKWG